MTPHDTSLDIPAVLPFTGGRRVMLGGAIAAGAGLGATGVLALFQARAALFSYLAGFAFWLGLALGVLALLLGFHASNARWMVVLRRLLESMTPMAAFALLFFPLLFGFRLLFGMERPSPAARVYFQPTFFAARALVYFFGWILLAGILRRWSLRQDESGGLELVARQRRLSAGALPFLGFSLTFAAIDWLMGLHPSWVSTIFGLYYFAGSFVGAIAAVILGVALVDRPQLLGGLVRPAHYYALGRLLLAFICFWGYIAFSQFLLIWIANLPEEAPWYLLRTRGGWSYVGIFLIVGHFVVPFALLLSKDLKFRRAPLAAIAGWVLFAHYIDLYWIIMPALSPASAAPRLSDFTAFIGIGGLATGAAVWRMRGRFPMPVRDPYLEHSLRYKRS